MTPPDPIHTRDAQGRHKINLNNIRSPWLRYGLAIFVVLLVFGLAAWIGREDYVSEDQFSPFVPLMGWSTIVLLVAACVAVFVARRK